jgi:hypothetical protein
VSYLHGQPEDPLGDTGIAFIDVAVNKVKGLVQNQVQAITERVADFKLLPRKHRELQVRLSALQNSAAVKANATWSKNVGTLLGNLSVAQGQWSVTNSTLDSALDQINAIRAGKVSSSTLAMAGSLITGMSDAFKKAKEIDNNTRAIESVALSPEQQKAALAVGGVNTQGFSLSTLALLLGGGYLLVRSMK